MKIGARVIKTAVAIVVAIGIAKLLGLAYYTSAGVITALCIQPSRKQSVLTSFKRIIACVLGLVLSLVLFNAAGYHIAVFLPLFLLLIPLLVRLKAQEGFGSSCVVIMHMFNYGKLDTQIIFNELLLIVISIGTAFIVNFYMTSQQKQLESYKQEIERQFAEILNQFSLYMCTGDNNWDGKEFLTLPDVFAKAKQTAKIEEENQFSRKTSSLAAYFQMREKQFLILQRIAPIISMSDPVLEQTRRYADFLHELSLNVNDQPQGYSEKLLAIRRANKTMPLPQTRQEFETRAELYQIASELENYLYLKREYLNHH